MVGSHFHTILGPFWNPCLGAPESSGRIWPIWRLLLHCWPSFTNGCAGALENSLWTDWSLPLEGGGEAKFFLTKLFFRYLTQRFCVFLRMGIPFTYRLYPFWLVAWKGWWIWHFEGEKVVTVYFLGLWSSFPSLTPQCFLDLKKMVGGWGCPVGGTVSASVKLKKQNLLWEVLK